MAHINVCLKRIFTIFNGILAILGILFIVLAGLAQMYTRNETEVESRTQGLIALYSVGILITLIAIMGAYGVSKESKGAMVGFLVCMVIGSLLMLRTGITIALARPGMERTLEMTLREFVPLDDKPDKVKNIVNTLQHTASCCGLFSNEDWKTIPDSCKCKRMELGTCQSVFRAKKTYFYRVQPTIEEHLVYAQPCFAVIHYYYQLVINIEIAIIFTLAALALLGMVLSSFMIHQMNRSFRPTVLLTAPDIFSPQASKYQELQNQPNPPKYQELQNLPKFEEVPNPPQYTEH